MSTRLQKIAFTRTCRDNILTSNIPPRLNTESHNLLLASLNVTETFEKPWSFSLPRSEFTMWRTQPAKFHPWTACTFLLLLSIIRKRWKISNNIVRFVIFHLGFSLSLSFFILYFSPRSTDDLKDRDTRGDLISEVA